MLKKKQVGSSPTASRRGLPFLHFIIAVVFGKSTSIWHEALKYEQQRKGKLPKEGMDDHSMGKTVK